MLANKRFSFTKDQGRIYIMDPSSLVCNFLYNDLLGLTCRKKNHKKILYFQRTFTDFSWKTWNNYRS